MMVMSHRNAHKAAFPAGCRGRDARSDRHGTPKIPMRPVRSELRTDLALAYAQPPGPSVFSLDASAPHGRMGVFGAQLAQQVLSR